MDITTAIVWIIGMFCATSAICSMATAWGKRCNCARNCCSQPGTEHKP